MATAIEQDLQRHAMYEVAAYVCRLGQFFYFAGSEFVANQLGSRPTMPTIERLLIFRHKFAAHRSVDYPRAGETAEIRVLQAFSLSCGGSSWRQTRKQTLGLSFQIRKNATDVEDFVPDDDHSQVMLEAFGVLEGILR